MAPFFMFYALGSGKEHKKYIKTEHQCSFVWVLLILIPFWAFLLLCGQVVNIFTMFFRDSEVCLEKCDSYGDFGYLTKNQKNLFEEKCVKENVVLLL